MILSTPSVKKKGTSPLSCLVNGKDPRRGAWTTPPEFFARVQEEFALQVDVCATAENAKLPRYFDRAANGLIQPWAPERCWCNPPYGNQIGRWLKKARWEAGRGAFVVCLIPARTDTNWWHTHVVRANEIRFLKGRIQFTEMKSSPSFPSAIVIFAPTKPWDGPLVRFG